MKIFGNDYATIVAENIEQAIKCYESEFDVDLRNEIEGELTQVDGSKRKMWFPVDMLPEKYQDKEEYPRRNCGYGEYIGVLVTLNEAMQYRKGQVPYVLSISKDLV